MKNINIELEFELGEVVWTSKRELDKLVVCDTCKGTGKLYSSCGVECNCGKCWGEGSREIDRLVPVETKIDGITINLRSEAYLKKHKYGKERKAGAEIYYSTEEDIGNPSQMTYYKTKEEAEEYIKCETAKTNYY